MATKRQLAANRANAAKSTGPLTRQGKAVSSQNAIRHGLTAERIVIGGENPEEFDDLLQQFIDKYEPRDRYESCLVERLAGLFWRLMRVPLFEAAVLGAYAHKAEVFALEISQFGSNSIGLAMAETPAPSTLGRMLATVLGQSDVLGKLARHEAHLYRLARLGREELDLVLKRREEGRLGAEDVVLPPADDPATEGEMLNSKSRDVAH